MRPPFKPFRWNVSNPKLRQRLKKGDVQILPSHDQDRLLRCGASALRVGDCDVVFVGRSLESLFDMLSGSLARTTWYDRLQLLQVSVRGFESTTAIHETIEERNAKFRRLKRPSAEDRLTSFRKYLEHCQLTPDQILKRPRDVVFIDIVAKGGTFGTLLELMHSCNDADSTWTAAKKRMHWVAVQPDPAKTKQPNWNPADSAGTDQFASGQIHEVVIDADLWCFLADGQFKTTHPYHPFSWGSSDIGQPAEYPWNDEAARGARELYRQGERSRRRLAALLDEAPEPVGAVTELARELRREA